MKRFLFNLFFVLIFFQQNGISQTQIASPQIVNYNHENYLAGIQNWDIAQDKNGILYFGNNEGLLTFNGRFWNLHKIPNLTVVRSVEIDAKNRIFVGGQDEAGYFFPNENGVLVYHSILPLIPEQHRKFADIWNIAIVNDEVFFRSTNLIIQLKDGVVKVYQPEIEWEFLGEVNNKLFAHSLGRGLMLFDKGIWKPYCNDPVLKESAVTSVLSYDKDTYLISTLKNGLFLMSNGILQKKTTALDKVAVNDRIYSGYSINENTYAYGTTSAGVFIIDKNGNLIERYAYKEGLQTNNIRFMLTDHNKNLWLALDDGIDFIAINSAVKSIFPDKNKQITSYAINAFKGNLYIGTSNGLYTSPITRNTELDLSLSKGVFTEVPNSKGQVWSLEEINNELLMGHEEGFFTVQGNHAKQIYVIPGTWLFQPVTQVFPSSTIIAGTYMGLQHIQYADNKFSNLGKISGIDESLRFIAFDNNNAIWASHPYRGVFKLELTDGYKKVMQSTLYTEKDGLPSALYNYVYKIKNRIVIATENGVYEFDAKTRKFKTFEVLNAALKGLSIQYLKEDHYGNVWFVSNKKVGVVDFTAPSTKQPFSVFYFPQLDGKVVGGFETIYTLNSSNVFIGANKGLYHLNYQKFKQSITQPRVVLGAVKLFGKKDSTIFGGYFLKNKEITFVQDLAAVKSYSYDLNSVHFEFSSTFFEQQKNIEFSYQLVDFDKNWSPWTNKSEKDYTNLPAGKYTFKVKARSSLGSESESLSYTFIILPAWYQTVWMYLLYLIILCVIIYIFFKNQQKKHISAQEKLSYLHQLELDRNEKEIVRLQYEKLEADVDFKNRELSTMTMHLVQRGKVLSKIKEVISTVIKNHDISDSSPSFRHLIRLIREVEKSDEDWDNFAIHFNNVNTDFFNKLKDSFPDLTPNELKLCAYLKMNLSSKEIAQLMNITIKAVEVGRYRLRKKLHLQPDTNLYDFLMQISRSSNKI